MWTSQGLNLGPPDYESYSDIFYRIRKNAKLPKIRELQ